MMNVTQFCQSLEIDHLTYLGTQHNLANPACHLFHFQDASQRELTLKMICREEKDRFFISFHNNRLLSPTIRSLEELLVQKFLEHIQSLHRYRLKYICNPSFVSIRFSLELAS